MKNKIFAIYLGYGFLNLRYNLSTNNLHKIKKPTFNEFCDKYLDGLYDPKFSYEKQSTGYKKLLEMVRYNIKPASLDEIKRWETQPTIKELTSTPDIKYLRFLHVLLREYVINHWNIIKTLKID